MAAAVPKQYLRIGQQTVLEYTLAALSADQRIVSLTVALAEQDNWWPMLSLPATTEVNVVAGGKERADSVSNALRYLLDKGVDRDDWVLVHDAARPCLSAADLSSLIDTLAQDEIGGLLAIPVTDTVKHVEDYRVLETVDRRLLWRAQTPQMFRLGALHDALIGALAAGHPVTDEASAMEWAGSRPRIIEGSADNLKLTLPADLETARHYLLPGDKGDSKGEARKMFRTGFGYDAHRFIDGVPLMLAGVEVAHSLGLEAHSDGDVAIHALCDALLGAAALGDIGQHFPDHDPRYRAIDSRQLLRTVCQRLVAAGFSVVNIDLTIVAQAPKLASYIPAMRVCLADDLALSLSAVNIKATTTERMGFAGRGEGIAAYSVVSLMTG